MELLVKQMETKNMDMDELEEQLVLLYRFVSQINTLKKFYYSGVDYEPSFEDDTGILQDLLDHEDSEEILKSCILELEEKNVKSNLSFHEILDSYDVKALYQKYDMQDVEDVNRLDLKKIVDSL